MAATPTKSAKPAGSPRFVPIAVGMAVVLILAAGGLLGFALREGPSNFSGGVLSSAIGGPFHLIDQNGKPFTDADLKGKWHLVFFGYTHCPDICPTTLNDLSLAFDKLDKQRQKDLNVVFVSVDPARDTPAVLKSYVASFDAPIIGLTGTAAEVRQAAEDYHVYYAKHVRADGGYDMDHSAVVYVMDPNGRFVATITPDEAVGEVEAKLQKLVS
jgi:protein SCO1